MTRASLPAPSRYFPLAHGKYEVAAGLRALGTDSGNGPEKEEKVFQFDAEYPLYRQAKEAARAERLEKYYPKSVGLAEEARARINRFIIESLTREWPEYFRLVDGRTLECALSAEHIVFDADYRLVTSEGGPNYRDLFDALASQLQEDLAVWRRDADGDPQGWLAAIHLCFPNHWAAEEKIGKAFNAVHQPVAGFGKLAKAAPSLVGMMVEKGPFVRFAWGLGTDRELNHHPANEFQGRAFDTMDPVLELRIERQTLTSFPEFGASLFTIRTYFLDVKEEISLEERMALVSAIDSMSAESLVYKGLDGSKEGILEWLGVLG